MKETDIKEYKYSLYGLKKWKEVSQEEFDHFVDTYKDKYGSELHDHLVYFCTPPIHGKYDFSINVVDGDATVCEVAYTAETGWYGDTSPQKWHIVDNIDEIIDFNRSIMGMSNNDLQRR